MDVTIVLFGDIGFSLGGKLHTSLQEYIKSNFTETEHVSKLSESEFKALRAVADAQETINPSKTSGLSGLLDAISKQREASAHTTSHIKLEDVVANQSEPFSQMLFRLIDAKELTDPEVYRRANITRSVFSAIRSKPDQIPSKNTVICLAIALELSLNNALELLRRVGYTLSPGSVHDLIVQYFINAGNFDIHSINETLYQYGQNTLGTRV